MIPIQNLSVTRNGEVGSLSAKHIVPGTYVQILYPGESVSGIEKRLIITFSDLTDLDPHIGGSNVVWRGPSGQISYGNDPVPLPDEIGDWYVTMEDYSACNAINVSTDNVSAIANLSLLKELISLDVFDNTLRNLDIRSNPNLKNVSAQNNQLTSIDTSQNHKLTKLLINGQRIKSLDLTNNPLLDMLWCSNTLLSSLDLSIHEVLVYLICRSNPSLLSITIPANNIISQLWLERCSLSIVDFSNLTSITDVTLSSNPALDVDTIVDQIDANKDIIPPGLLINIAGTCPAVSPASDAKILVMAAPPYNHSWTRNI